MVLILDPDKQSKTIQNYLHDTFSRPLALVRPNIMLYSSSLLLQDAHGKMTKYFSHICSDYETIAFTGYDTFQWFIIVKPEVDCQKNNLL